ncbi:MAG: stage II sporulation protein R [Clostridiales bacterium]|nr:stage II sporulation protein R [Clostridiales bacterium]
MKFKFFVPVFIIVLLFCFYIAPFVSTSEKISTDVFRLHILANSDSDEDQNLKLKVRDAVLEASNEIFTSSLTIDETIELCSENLDVFKAAAENCIKENGYDYGVNIYIAKEYFETRQYESITLPGGVYNALKIEIGQGAGQNWWCVMFPAICLSAVSEDEIEEILDADEIELINSGQKYKVKFKIVEIYEKIKYRLTAA